jgi:hypothetical protein
MTQYGYNCVDLQNNANDDQWHADNFCLHIRKKLQRTVSGSVVIEGERGRKDKYDLDKLCLPSDTTHTVKRRGRASGSYLCRRSDGVLAKHKN